MAQVLTMQQALMAARQHFKDTPGSKGAWRGTVQTRNGAARVQIERSTNGTGIGRMTRTGAR